MPARHRIVALLPGSRLSELRRHADLFVHTAQWLSARHPDIRFVVPFASQETRALFEQALHRQRADERIFRLLDHRSRDAMAVADIVLLASGTAALEGVAARQAHGGDLSGLVVFLFSDPPVCARAAVFVAQSSGRAPAGA